ncbi:MAG: RsmG family class I SAM-dependent methyltransferase [Actinomycetota bacterium]
MLDAARRRGMIGDAANVDIISHARRFTGALVGVRGSIIDLGSGGGVPGLVIAVDRPDLTVTLLDRRQKRTDFLQQMVQRLELDARVDVVVDDADRFLGAGGQGHQQFDAATARGFGPPARTVRTALRAIRPGGRIVISDPPTGERWATVVADLPLQRVELGKRGLAVFDRIG